MGRVRNRVVIGAVLVAAALGKLSWGASVEPVATVLPRPRPPTRPAGPKPVAPPPVNGVGATELLARPELAAYVTLAMQQLALEGSAEVLRAQVPSVLSAPQN